MRILREEGSGIRKKKEGQREQELKHVDDLWKRDKFQEMMAQISIRFSHPMSICIQNVAWAFEFEFANMLLHSLH
jgi:hypothetical protein